MMKTFREYIFDNDNMNAFRAAVVTDAVKRLEELINEFSDRELIDFMQEYGEEVYQMEDLDDICGSIYPSEVPDLFPSCYFDFDDDFFIKRSYNEYESRNDIFDLTGTDVNDIATAYWNDEIDYCDDDLQGVKDEALELLQKGEEYYQKQKHIVNIYDIVNSICDEDAGIDQIKELETLLWNAYNK